MLSAGSALSLDAQDVLKQTLPQDVAFLVCLGRKALPAGSHRLRFPAGVTVLRETELVGMIIMNGNLSPLRSAFYS